VISARTVSEMFFFDFSHSICSGMRKTLIRSVFMERDYEFWSAAA